MKLFYTPGACSLAAHMTLCELGLKFSAERVDLKSRTWSGGDYRKVTVKGLVPALELDNGEVLTEGAVILQYLADLKPESSLLPKVGSWERYRTQEWLNFVSSDIHKGFGLLFAADRMVASKEGNDQLKSSAKEALLGKVSYISEKLGSKNYLMGDQFTVADAYMATCLSWGPLVGMDYRKWPNVEKYLERVTSRPKIKEAMKAEGLIKN